MKTSFETRVRQFCGYNILVMKCYFIQFFHIFHFPNQNLLRPQKENSFKFRAQNLFDLHFFEIQGVYST